MKTNDTHAPSTNDGIQSSRLRLALVELARIDREIAEIEQRPAALRDHEPLLSLRACRAALLRTAVMRLLVGSPAPGASTPARQIRREPPKPS